MEVVVYSGMSPTIAASIEAALVETSALTGISVEEITESLREPMIVIGDQAGVNLRDLPADQFRLFTLRFWDLTAKASFRRGVESFVALPDEEANDIFNDAAWQAIHELFVPQGEA
jgi:hypothetical protein